MLRSSNCCVEWCQNLFRSIFSLPNSPHLYLADYQIWKTKPSLSSAPEAVTPVSVIQCEYRLARPLQASACPIAHTSWLLCQKNIEQMTIRRVCNSKLTVLTKQLNMASDLNVLVHAAFKQFRLITGFQSALLGFRRQWWWPSNKHTDKLMRYELTGLTGNCNGFRVPSAKQMQTEYQIDSSLLA